MFTGPPCPYNAYAYDAEFDASFHEEDFQEWAFRRGRHKDWRTIHGLFVFVFIFSHSACRWEIPRPS